MIGFYLLIRKIVLIILKNFAQVDETLTMLRSSNLCYNSDMLDIYGTLEIEEILRQVKEYTHSELAVEYFNNLKMFSSKEEISLELSQLDEMMKLVNAHDQLPIKSSFNLEQYLDLAKKGGVLSILDLDHIANDIDTTNKLNLYFRRLEKNRYPKIYEIVDKLYDLTMLSNQIRRVITPDLQIRDDASPQLQGIRRQISKLTAMVRESSRPLITKYADYLSEKTMSIRNDHFVLPVLTSYKQKVPGIIHDISDTGTTTFIEPEQLVQMSNQILSLRVEEKEEIYRLLKELSQKVSFHADEIRNNNLVIAKLDEVQAKALFAFKCNAVVASLSDEQVIHLEGARHPLIDPAKVVENDFHLTKETSMIIISGPNAGGKTVALKTLGLLVMMNQMGFALPTKIAGELGYFPRIYADIGDNQSLSDNLSTFAAHVSNLSTITHFVSSKDLVLLDELGTGTSPREGEALALSVADFLLCKKVFTMISSHFDKMKEFAYTHDHVTNAMMVFDEKKLVPTYKLKVGSSGRSYGLEMAKRYHLDENVVSHAKEYLQKEQHGDINDVMNHLNTLVNENEQKQKELVEKERQLANKQKHLAHEEEVLLSKKEHLLEQVKDEEQKILNDALSKVDFIMKNLDKEDLKLHEVIQAKTKLNDFINDTKDEEVHLTNENIEVGDMVEVFHLGLVGKVTKMTSKKVYLVTPDGFQVTAKKEDLSLTDRLPQPKVQKRDYDQDLKLNTNLSLELNIIGFHVDEGLEAVSKYLDECRLRHLKTVRIIHGMGSGKLREAVQNYLKKCDFIEEYRYGNNYEGGTGATVVTLK